MNSTEPSRSYFSRLIRDPLLHFLVFGGCIYLVYGLTNENAVDAPVDAKTVVVGAGELAWMESSWEKRWNRPPTPQERQGMIDQYVRETVLFKEAIAMGLDQDDVVIRRRLAQKLEFLTQDMLQPQPPGDDEIRAYFATNKDSYRAPELISMTHVFFDPDRRGDATLDDAEVAKARLIALGEAPVDIKNFGDAFLLQDYYPQRSEDEVAKLFGSGFAEPVFKLEPGKWNGPVLSGYGAHLVYIHEKITPPEPKFDEIAERVLADWVDEKRGELNDQFMTALLERYTVVVEEPADEATGDARESTE